MKKFLFLFAVVLTALQMSAADVTPAQAQAAANSFLRKQVAAGQLKASAVSNLQLVKAEASVARPTAVDYYIFNSTKAYVVVSGDDLAPQILMYGEEGSLDLNNIPPGMQWLLNKYKYQIDGLKAGTMVPVKLPKFATTPVAPLVTANWDQSAPYYNQCPTSGSRRALTGCPATSLAMCYYKWKWPETYPAVAAINGSYSGGLSAPALPERAADWDNIIDEYTGPSNYSSTSAQKDAVAWLMRYAGQAIPDYMYGTSASGADDPEIYQGCLNMGYTDAQYLLLTELQGGGWSGYSNGPQHYTDAQWNEFMLNELHNGRPIEYLAYDYSSYSLSGHAFNVFGCNASGQYYVNWGWSGDSNGYCTLHNFTTATGATGQSGSYVFNYGEAMIIGIEPPAGALNNPRITVNPTTLSMNTTVGTPVTATFTVTGANLTSRVNLSISGNNAFSLSTTSISASQAENGVNVTVTYNPSAVGNHEATVTLTSTDAETVTVKVNGIADLETYDPVMLDATNITSTSFKATWTDQTPSQNVESYTLYVSAEPFKPAVALLDSIVWTANNNLPTGWTQTGLTYYGSNSACYLSSNYDSYVKSGNYDLSGYDKVTVMIYSEPYNSSNTLTVATSVDSKTVSLPNGAAFAWYTFVLDCASNDYVRITSSGMPDMRYVKVYAGDPTNAMTAKASETGDATYRVITGITSKSYTVNGLTEGGSFYFYVVANYTNGAVGNSNVKEVTLNESTLQKETPIMLPANEEYINLTQFRADWTHGTPAENVTSYTLEVTPKPETPDVPDPVLLEDADFTNLAAAENSEGQLTNVASSASNYLPAGWTAQTGLWVNDGFIISGNLNNNVYGITSKTYDFTGYDKVTVVMSAYSYYAEYYGNATMRVRTSAGSQNVVLAIDDFTTYTVVLDVAQSDRIVFEGVQNLFAIEDIKIYAGDVNAINAMLLAQETGDENSRLITGITDKFYTVENLAAGGTFLYRVKALYIDGSESNWSNIEEVTLFENGPAPHGYAKGDVNHDGAVTIKDVSDLIDYLLGNGDVCTICADMNGDNSLTIADVSAIIDSLLGGNNGNRLCVRHNRLLAW